MTNSLYARPYLFRHVTFPGIAGGGGPPLNFAEPEVRRYIPAAGTHELSPDEEETLHWLFEQAGLDLHHYRSETLKRRIPACLRAARIESLTELREAAERRPQIVKAALSALIIGVTSFFRDAAVFASLEQQVIPELAASPKGARVWSVGCSDGAELYSIALLLAERKVLHRCSLLGTDCRVEAVNHAREGAYDPGLVRGVPPELLARYFTFRGTYWQVQPWLRTVTQWRTANALAVREPGSWDMILCRNVSIYMQPEATIALWRSLAGCLRLGGILVLGKAERPLGCSRMEPVAPCIYRRE